MKEFAVFVFSSDTKDQYNFYRCIPGLQLAHSNSFQGLATLMSLDIRRNRMENKSYNSIKQSFSLCFTLFICFLNLDAIF